MRQQNRQFQLAQDAGCGPAHNKVAHTGVAKGPHDHHVGADFVRVILQCRRDGAPLGVHQ